MRRASAFLRLLARKILCLRIEAPMKPNSRTQHRFASQELHLRSQPARIRWLHLDVRQPFDGEGSTSNLSAMDGYLVAWDARQGDIDGLSQVPARLCRLEMSPIEQINGIAKYLPSGASFPQRSPTSRDAEGDRTGG